MYSSLMDYMKAYEKRLESEIREYNRKIGKLPDGHLGCFKNRQYYTWYRLFNDKNAVSRTLIPKSKRKLAEQLAIREYYEHAVGTERKQLKAIRLFLKYFDNHCPGERYLASCPEHRNLLKGYIPMNCYSEDQLAWMYKERPEPQPRENELTVPTVLGYDVRSKSESSYVTSFANHHIVFRYEWPLYLESSNKTIFPDFTVMHPVTGETIYIEHYGVMDDIDYAKKAALKTYEYFLEGILPGKNLFFSYESKNHKFSSINAEEIVRKLFVEV